MSQIMEKTLASLPKLLSQSLIGGGNSKMPQRQPPSMDVQNFMKQIHKARSRSQEAAIVKSQLMLMKEKLKGVDVTPSVVRCCYTKVIFCYQLGYDVSGMALEAIKLASKSQGFDKRLGYLVSRLLLHSRHEITILMTSTIIKDLMSANMTDNCLALEVAGELMDIDSIPCILEEVVRKFTHQQDLVKEKALHCFRCFYQKVPDMLEPYIPKLTMFLTSRDPGVLMAVANMYRILTSRKPTRFVGLAASFMHILDQINSRGFGSVYYYHMVALPWLQISLLKILSNLAQVDPDVSRCLEPILKTLIEKTKVSVPISLALLVESIQTATKIQASESLLQLCSRCIMKLMASDSSEDMRYQGLGLLISLSKIKPSYAVQHQAAVMECLASDDVAIQSRTAFLLHAMANSSNIKIICEKLFDQHKISKDHEFREEILEMIVELLQKCSLDIEWYVNTAFRVLSHNHGAHDFRDRVVDSLLKKVEQFHCHNEILDTSGLTKILETMISHLEKETDVNHRKERIQLLGVVIPLIPEQFLQVDRFFNIMTTLIFNAIACDTSAKSKVVLMNPPGQVASSGHIASDLIHDKSEIRVALTCVDTVIKLVLAECLDCRVVQQWLETNNHKGCILNGFLRGGLQELEDLVFQPSAIKGISQIMFQSELSDLDLSLSFLDPLIVQDLLKGGECYKPKYIKEAEKVRHNLTLSSMTLTLSHSNYEEEKSSLSLTGSLPADLKTPGSSKPVKGRWHDGDANSGDSSDEDDVNKQFCFVNSVTSVNGEDINKNKHELAEQLFAGLDSCNLTEPSYSPSDSGISNSSSKGFVKSQKNMWDDDDDDDDGDDGTHTFQNNSEIKSSFFSMDLHPFGLPKKGSPKPNVWCDDDDDHRGSFQTDMQTKPSALKNFTLADQSAKMSLYDPVDTPSYSPTYIYHEADTDSVDSSVNQSGLSIARETGLSMYSEFSDGQSPVLLSPDITASTVDTLTDSDPDGT